MKQPRTDERNPVKKLEAHLASALSTIEDHNKSEIEIVFAWGTKVVS